MKDRALTAEEGALRCRIHHPEARDTLIYLPGLHGDWTLLGPFRNALLGRLRLIEFTYPRNTDWTLDDYAAAVLAELERRGVTRGWVLAESFSSQAAWAIARRLSGNGPAWTAPLATSDRQDPAPARAGFEPCGLILVGGFVKHPWPSGVRLAHWISAWIPLWLVRGLCASYGRWACRRCRDAGADASEIDLFVARRSIEADRAAITSRYILIRDDDMRPAAQSVRWPVFSLTGAVDPIVPWPLVWRWLRRRCPGFVAGRVVWRAGHNVLLDAPAESAEQILSWVLPSGVIEGG